MSTYDYVVSIIIDETRITRDQTQHFLDTGEEGPDPVARFRARVSKEQLIEAMADTQADAADVAWIKRLLKEVYGFEPGAS